MLKPSYRSFLLRLWFSSDAEAPVCRALLEDVHTHAIVSFANLDGLKKYLQANLLETPDPRGDALNPDFSEEKS